MKGAKLSETRILGACVENIDAVIDLLIEHDEEKIEYTKCSTGAKVRINLRDASGQPNNVMIAGRTISKP